MIRIKININYYILTKMYVKAYMYHPKVYVILYKSFNLQYKRGRKGKERNFFYFYFILSVFFLHVGRDAQTVSMAESVVGSPL